jgi:hypothetical protein
MSEQEELNIYRDFLIYLHTARWTGNGDSVMRCLEAVGGYSYCRTNGNEYDEYPKPCEEESLLRLKNIHEECIRAKKKKAETLDPQ